MAAVNVHGELQVPGDKSISHRALILSAIANGPSRLRGLLTGADVQSTRSVLHQLGVEIPALGPDVQFRGMGRRALRAPSASLDCGNSGTTTRLVAGLVAGSEFSATFVGDESLSRRPMQRLATALESLGARVEVPPGDGLPMHVFGGPLRPSRSEALFSSAQVKSAYLLAALVGDVRATYTEPVRSRDHTERMLEARGVGISRTGTSVTITPGDVHALDVDIPGDPSSAAFFIALATLAGGGSLTLPRVCVNTTRTGFIDALRRMGAQIALGDESDAGGEPVATITVSPASLRGTTIGGHEVPYLIDELPLLACVAARADGETVVTGAGELRGKESDRIAAVVSNLVALGVEAEELPDGFRVHGSSKPLRGRVATHGDHRLAMSFGILSAVAGGEIVLDDRDCVSISYPAFWSDLANVIRG